MEKAAVRGELPEKYQGACMKFVSFPYWNKRMGELLEIREDMLEEARAKIETEKNPEALREYERRAMVLPVKIERMKRKMSDLSKLGDREISRLTLFSLGSDESEVLDYFTNRTPGIMMQYGMMQKALAMHGG